MPPESNLSDHYHQTRSLETPPLKLEFLSVTCFPNFLLYYLYLILLFLNCGKIKKLNSNNENSSRRFSPAINCAIQGGQNLNFAFAILIIQNMHK